MKNKSYSIESGLFFVLVLLKLTGVIDWSWWIILAPVWVPFAIALVALVIGGLYNILKKK